MGANAAELHGKVATEWNVSQKGEASVTANASKMHVHTFNLASQQDPRTMTAFFHRAISGTQSILARFYIFSYGSSLMSRGS